MWQLFKVTKPLELGWRFATARFRVLPDMVIVGEVRCGTTTLADHLKSLPGATGAHIDHASRLGFQESHNFPGFVGGVEILQKLQKDPPCLSADSLATTHTERALIGHG
jgi:hypothetical protein